eukprot:scaffold29030_cov34-Phaeocystis_antarctica.AAC.1
MCVWCVGRGVWCVVCGAWGVGRGAWGVVCVGWAPVVGLCRSDLNARRGDRDRTRRRHVGGEAVCGVAHVDTGRCDVALDEDACKGMSWGQGWGLGLGLARPTGRRRLHVHVHCICVYTGSYLRPVSHRGIAHAG